MNEETIATNYAETEIPFFFLKIRRGRNYHVFNPVDNKEYVINYAECRIAEQCDGTHTLDEIASTVQRDFGMTKAEATTYVATFFDKMCNAGIVALRDRKMTYWTNYPPPSAVYWDITRQCNLKCTHCYYPDYRPHESEFSTEEIKRALQEMSTFGVRSIVFSGGEPLLRRDFFEIASHAKSLGFETVSLSTNGTLIDHEIARQLKALDLDVQVSIDGDIAEIHDTMRGMKGAFDHAIRGIKLLQEEGIDVSVCTVVTKLNFDRMPRILQLMQDLNVRRYRTQYVLTMGRGNMNRAELRVPSNRRKGLVEYLESRGVPNNGYNFTLKSPPRGAVDYRATGACAAATSKCSITAGGNVVPCTTFWGMNGENLRDHTFQWIWENSTLLNYFRSFLLDDIKGVCRSCKWLSLCYGGCKAVNYVNGDIFGSSPECWVADEMRQAVI